MDNLIPTQRINAYDLLNTLINENLSKIDFYHIITKNKYKIIGIETSLSLDDYFIKVYNLSKKQTEKIKNHELQNLEIITKENHP